MNPLELVFGIVLVVMIARVIRDRYRYGATEAPPPDTAETQMLRHDVQMLKERVQVLERVITDNRSSLDLDREIERLRDQR